MATNPFDSQSGVKSVVRIPSSELSHHPQLRELTVLINHAFVTSWATIPGLIGADRKRYESPEEFASDMGSQGATYVALGDNGEIVATAGYKPWNQEWKALEMLKAENGDTPAKEEAEVNAVATASDVHQEMARQNSGIRTTDFKTFEVVSLATNPNIQKRGLGSRITRLVEEELEAITKAKGSTQVRFMVRTGKENNEVYWTRMGYRVVGQTYFKKGDFGSETGFTVLIMEKVVRV